MRQQTQAPFLMHSTMTLHTMLSKNRLNIPSEINLLFTRHCRQRKQDRQHEQLNSCHSSHAITQEALIIPQPRPQNQNPKSKIQNLTLPAAPAQSASPPATRSHPVAAAYLAPAPP